MATDLTPKQEAFAQAYVETGSASEAYRRAYNVGAKTKPEVVHVKASELLKNGKVAVRVAELQAAAQERHEITVDDLIAELEEARDIAKAEGQAAAAVSATLGKAKLLGLLVDKVEKTGKGGGPIVQDVRITEADRKALREVLE